MLVMSAHYFLEAQSGIMIGKSIASTNWYRLALRLHIFFGLIAMLIGIIQLLPQQNRKRHRISGIVYVSSVAISGGFGLLVAQYAMGGWVTTLGFSFLAIVWLGTTFLGVKTAIQGQLVAHKKWMWFSYALTFAAIPQRTMLLIPLLTTVPFMPIYRLSAWLPWLLNLAVTYLLLYRIR